MEGNPSRFACKALLLQNRQTWEEGGGGGSCGYESEPVNHQKQRSWSQKCVSPARTNRRLGLYRVKQEAPALLGEPAARQHCSLQRT
uniref:Uncharacterized protein n=1 Tax=Zea mays TaxID=4577 RepID=C0PJY5_MAIZE|nr:unknown [Zea mays]